MILDILLIVCLLINFIVNVKNYYDVKKWIDDK